MIPEPSHHTLITAKRVTGTPVFDRTGEKIGHVEDLSIDKISGQVVSALLSFGGFLGIGERFHLLPWDVLSYDAAVGGYVVGLDKAQLAATKSFSLTELEPLGAPEPGWPRLGVI